MSVTFNSTPEPALAGSHTISMLWEPAKGAEFFQTKMAAERTGACPIFPGGIYCLEV